MAAGGTALFAEVDNAMRIAREEIFGPVLSMIPFDTEEEAIRIANDTPYGLTAYVFHQDQVESVPQGATVIGSSPQCPIGALAYRFPALSVQYHPEFVEEYARFLLDKKRETLPSAVVDATEESILKLSVDNAAIAEWAAGFFRANVEAVSGNPTEMRP